MKKIIVLIVLGFSFLSHAQQDEQMSLYMFNPLYFNPAYAGSRDAISAVAQARFQWVNFKGAPTTQWFSVHAPILHKALGIGAHMINDHVGTRSRTSVYADISSNIQLNKKGDRIALGINAGMDAFGYDFSGSQVIDQNDPYYGQVFNTTKPNIGAGIYYHGEKHYIGFSIPRLFETKLDNYSSVIQSLTARHFYLSGGYVFTLNSVLKLKPSTLIKYTPHAPLTLDVNASLLMYERIWAGILYRYNEAMGINFVYNIKQTFQLGYNYDFPINGLRKYQSGTHEIVLQLDIRPKKSVYTSPRYF